MDRVRIPTTSQRWLFGWFSVLTVLLICLLIAVPLHAQTDLLPSWNDGPTKGSVLKFVATVTTEGSPDYIPPAQRIAVFDNDGTLWTEQPMYVPDLFVFDRIRQLAVQHPEWKEQVPFKYVLQDDRDQLAHLAEKDFLELNSASQAGITTEEFEKIVKEWLASARHPRYQRSFTDLVYKPMLELLDYLRANGFKTFIVSGGGIDFMRPWTESVYGIPPEQVVGSTVKLAFEIQKERPVLMRLPRIDFINNREGKPVGIHNAIGRRPLAAFGNSDGDLQMLQWTAAGEGVRFMLLVHHDDGEREYAYDRNSPIGRLDKALDQARERGWVVVSMKKDWKVVYPFEKR